MLQNQLQTLAKSLRFEPYEKWNSTNSFLLVCAFFAIAVPLTVISTLNRNNSSSTPLKEVISYSTSYEIQSFEMPPSPIDNHYTGEVKGSFFISALEAGLSSQQVNKLFNKLTGHFDFFSSVEEGGRFVVSTELGNKSSFTGFLYQNHKGDFIAILHKNGRLYNAKAEPLNPLFLTNPTFSKYPISSHFDPYRVHPVTRRTVPHNGTDYMLPVGSSVVSVGSGTIVAARYDKYAGNYITIRHTDNYLSRYLHLSKILVLVGDEVHAGQKIAQSGNTGRTTGAHLHFELLKNGRPIDFVEWSDKNRGSAFEAGLSPSERQDVVHTAKGLLNKIRN
ncbi:peptidoglycan DD-metalloendopeptidase family protein [Vibrio maritimus]|uniref:peptidoglycan DD-metalloendopeptidase family protein n=1 Tax=Vibrio maritimus TaxID=990268 RepID=UPI001F41F19F|nr:peptidoglycan DD-metalloendopeptidase family protein [Vibrio maritimus]